MTSRQALDSTSPVPSARHSALRTTLTSVWSRLRGGALAGASLAVVATLWQAAVHWRVVPEGLVPSPFAVAETGWELLKDGTLGAAILASGRRALLGFLFGSIIGVFVGLLTGRSRVICFLLEPLLQLLRPIPALAWLPLTILWLGVGETQKVFLIAMGVFFAVWLQTHAGVRMTPPHYVEVAQSLGYGKRQIFTAVSLPATMPYIGVGLRQGIALAFLLLVAAELAGASAGLGYLITSSRVVFRSDVMFVGLAALGVLGALVDLVFAKVFRHFVHWT